MRRKSRWLFRVVFVLLSLISLSAHADGKFFGRAIAKPVSTPDQRAMLYFSNDVERLVIETSFSGEGTNFAWVVPLPVAPKIEAVSTNFFTSLNNTFQPNLIYRSSDLWTFFLFLGAIVSSAIWHYQKGPKPKILFWFGSVILLTLIFGMAVPNFVMPRGYAAAKPASSVTVLAEQKVGIYNTATISSFDGQALLTWLNGHGFFVPTNALPVISSYSAEKWVFVAVSVDRDQTAETRSQAHPLAFTFQTAKPVYPLRLTGVENPKCTIELFVFGPARAQAKGFNLQYCGKPFLPSHPSTEQLSNQKELFAFPDPGEYRIMSDEVRRFAMPATVATKLVGNLSSEDMRTDATIDWNEFQPVFPTLYSPDAAADAAWGWSVGVFVIGALTVQILAFCLNWRQIFATLLSAILIAGLAGFIRWKTVRTVDFEFIPGSWHMAANDFRELDGALQTYAIERANPGPLTFPELRTSFSNQYRSGVFNVFTRQPLQNEPTPGNITLRQNLTNVDVLWYDINGNSYVITSFGFQRPGSK